MRHRRKINHLSRKSAHRKAMLANMASSLIIHKRINTTVAKAKALRTYVEPLITKSKLSVTTKTSKEEATHLRRVVFSYLQNKEAVTELFREISTKVADRPGGYTRIIKTGARLGDNAEMCMMELVDYNENLLTEKAAESKSKRRRRGGKKKTEEGAVAETETAVADAPVEDVAEEVTEEVKTEEPAAEAQTEEAVEAKVEEAVKEEVKEEVKTEAEVAEEPVKEEKAEEPVAEVKEETKVEEPAKEEPEAKAEEPAKEEPKEESKDDEEKDKN